MINMVFVIKSRGEGISMLKVCVLIWVLMYVVLLYWMVSIWRFVVYGVYTHTHIYIHTYPCMYTYSHGPGTNYIHM